MQTSGIYSVLITSFNDFEKSFSLWNDKKDQIKESFTYLDLSIIEILGRRLISNQNDPYYEIKKECLQYYVNTHVTNQSYIWPFVSEKEITSVQRYKKEIKENLTKLCSKLGMSQSVEKLKEYNVDENILNKASSIHKLS